jgi:hypothetical protein
LKKKRNKNLEIRFRLPTPFEGLVLRMKEKGKERMMYDSLSNIEKNPVIEF